MADEIDEKALREARIAIDGAMYRACRLAIEKLSVEQKTALARHQMSETGGHYE